MTEVVLWSHGVSPSQTAREAHFNTTYACARTVVERTVKMLKGRWESSGGKLLYESNKVCQIILACWVPHNISLSHGRGMKEDEMLMDVEDPPPLPTDCNTHDTALVRRWQLIHMLLPTSNYEFTFSICDRRIASDRAGPWLDNLDSQFYYSY